MCRRLSFYTTIFINVSCFYLQSLLEGNSCNFNISNYVTHQLMGHAYNYYHLDKRKCQSPSFAFYTWTEPISFTFFFFFVSQNQKATQHNTTESKKKKKKFLCLLKPLSPTLFFFKKKREREVIIYNYTMIDDK